MQGWLLTVICIGVITWCTTASPCKLWYRRVQWWDKEAGFMARLWSCTQWVPRACDPPTSTPPLAPYIPQPCHQPAQHLPSKYSHIPAPYIAQHFFSRTIIHNDDSTVFGRWQDSSVRIYLCLSISFHSGNFGSVESLFTISSVSWVHFRKPWLVKI